MSAAHDIAALVAELIGHGVDPGVAAAVVAKAVIAGSAKDEAAERRRAWDRERKRQKRAISSGIPPDNADPSPLAESPPDPQKTQPQPTSPPSPLSGAHGSSPGGPVETLGLFELEPEAIDDLGPSPFDRLWQAYPNKTGKGAARKAFDKARDKAPLATMLAAIELQRGWRRWQEGFVPNPATWLNQERWADQPEESANARRERPYDDYASAKRRAHEANMANALAGCIAAAEDGRRRSAAGNLQ